MTQPTVTCGRCGAQNIAGDQFCGSCGAFLEFVAEQGAAVTPAGANPLPADPSLATSVPLDGGLAGLKAGAGGPAPARAPSPPSSTAPSAAAAASGPASEALVRCPACGIANALDRTFCQSCGSTLAGARIATAVGGEWAGLPPAAPSTSVGIAGPTQVSGVQPGPTSRRGFPLWILGVAVAGLVVGALVVGGSVFLRSGTSGPSGQAATVAPSVAPSVSAVPTGVAASPSPSAPPKGVALALTGAKASTVVGNRPKFAAPMAIDRDAKTAWQEGAIQEAGQWIEVTFAPASRLDALVIHNGYQASNAAFLGNRRVKDIRITVDGGTPIEARLKDASKSQRVDLGGLPGGSTIRIEIVSTYGPKKTAYPGSPFDDAAISEIAVIGVPAS